MCVKYQPADASDSVYAPEQTAFVIDYFKKRETSLYQIRLPFA